jgi:hypothetical protein
MIKTSLFSSPPPPGVPHGKKFAPILKPRHDLQQQQRQQRKHDGDNFNYDDFIRLSDTIICSFFGKPAAELAANWSGMRDLKIGGRRADQRVKVRH